MNAFNAEKIRKKGRKQNQRVDYVTREVVNFGMKLMFVFQLESILRRRQTIIMEMRIRWKFCVIRES